MTRRNILLAGVAVTGLAALTGTAGFLRRGTEPASAENFEITMTDAQWKAQLTPNQFAVLRNAGTERAGSSPLLEEKRAGVYHCAGCDLAAYSAADKYDSGTGWPSFTKAIEAAVATKPDPQVFGTLTEVHCRRCGGHFGHIFEDGPAPLGKRHCINGLSLKFVAA
jgi:peptide-methionine (R)-S-oxide reductase